METSLPFEAPEKLIKKEIQPGDRAKIKENHIDEFLEILWESGRKEFTREDLSSIVWTVMPAETKMTDIVALLRHAERPDENNVTIPTISKDWLESA